MKVAKSYQSWNYDETKAYDKGGKMYVHATCKCDRCVKGVFVCRIENGQPVPHPNAGGICFACGGTGIQSKEIRLYTDAEYEKMEQANARASEKKEQERKEKMKKEFAEKHKKWLNEHGFNQNETTFAYFPADSFNVKEQLKEMGFVFDYTLLWHIAEVPEGYEDKVVEIALRDIAEVSAWGDAHYIEGAKDKVASIMKAARPRPEHESQWIGEVKDKITDLPVTLNKVIGFTSKFGYSQIVVFETEDHDIVKWFTAVQIPFEEGEKLLLSGTIKDLIEDKYEDNAKVTILTRCRMKEG